jgi:hypothetical protein
LKPRSTLKSYFTKGAIPKESDFADLIDSMLIQDEDTVFKSANDPLSIKATGAEEALLNFYRVEQGNNMLTWQLKQKPTGAKPGLSIGDSAGTSLFIESGSGNIGIGTITPGAKLEVNGGLTVTGQTRLSAEVGINRAPIANQHLLITPTAGNIPLNVTDPTNSINWLSVFPTGNVIMNGGNVGIGTTVPVAKLDIQGVARTDLSNHPPTINGLYVTGNYVQDGSGVEFRHTNGTQGIGFGYNTIYATGSNPNQDLNLKPRGTGNVGIGTTTPKVTLDVNGYIMGRSPVDRVFRDGEAPGGPSESARAKGLLADKPNGTYLIGGPTSNYPFHIFFYWKANNTYYRTWIPINNTTVETF